GAAGEVAEADGLLVADDGGVADADEPAAVRREDGRRALALGGVAVDDGRAAPTHAPHGGLEGAERVAAVALHEPVVAAEVDAVGAGAVAQAGAVGAESDRVVGGVAREEAAGRAVGEDLDQGRGDEDLDEARLLADVLADEAGLDDVGDDRVDG